MQRALVTLALALALAVFSAAPAAALQIITEISPPLNHTEDGSETGKVTGLATELVQEAMKRMGVDYKIEVMPWARGYKLVQEKPDVALYSTTRTEAREKLFKWAGPLASSKWVLFKKAGSGVNVSSLEEARVVGSIGTYQNDAKEQFLATNGFTNLDSATDPLTGLKKLMAGRNDLWVSGDIAGFMMAKENGFSASDLEIAYVIKEAQLYMAFSQGTSDETVANWQKAFDAIEADGTKQKITDKWLK